MQYIIHQPHTFQHIQPVLVIRRSRRRTSLIILLLSTLYPIWTIAIQISIDVIVRADIYPWDGRAKHIDRRVFSLSSLSQLNQRCPQRTRSIRRLQLHRSITHLTRRGSTSDGIITAHPWCGRTALHFKIIRRQVRRKRSLAHTRCFSLFQLFIPRILPWILHLRSRSSLRKQRPVLELRLSDRVTLTHRSWIWCLRFISTYLCRRPHPQQQRILRMHTCRNVLCRPK